MDLMNYFLGTAGFFITLLIMLIPIIIGIALIVAIFQINGRVGELVNIQRIHAQQAIQAVDLQRQAFIAQLVADGPNHKAYLGYLVDLSYLTQDQADFILKQSGGKVVEEQTAGS
jgi:uncharacterized membrane protein